MTQPQSGRVPLGVKEFITVGLFIFGIGGTWATLGYKVSANEQKTEQVSNKVEADQQNILVLQGDVADLTDDVNEMKGDVKEVKVEQMTQRILLTEILSEIKNRNGSQ